MPKPENQLLDKLVNFFGPNKVLTASEHLYVYSHFGGFGVKSSLEPLAVVRLASEAELARLKELIGGLDVEVIRNDERDAFSENDPQKPYLLIDVQKPITIKDLERRLSELDEEKRELRNGLERSDYPMR